MKLNTQDKSECLTDIKNGLTSKEVDLLPKNIMDKGNSKIAILFRIIFEQVKSVFFILLLASAILSFMLGGVTDAWIFIVINIINLCLGTVQDFRAALATKALETLVTHVVSVVRDRLLIKIKSTELVKGDILLLGPGDILPVDLLLREVDNIFIDESVLTGESVPVEGKVNEIRFAGTSVVSGTARSQVSAIGNQSSLSKYANKLKKVRKSSSFNIFMTNVNKGVILLTISCILLTGIVSVLILHKITFSNFLLYGVSMLVGVVPESLAIIITIMLTHESLMLAREKVIVKNLTALQELGQMDFLLTDKTGTLTENRIKMIDKKDLGSLDKFAIKMATSSHERTPMDIAFDTSICLFYKVKEEVSGEQVKHIPYTSEKGYSTLIFSDGTEIFSGQFHAVRAMVGLTKDEYESDYESFESKGLRVMALAAKDKNETNSRMVGMIVFEDPLKADAAESYNNAQNLGIKVKILTGDSSLVATYVAKKLDKSLTDKEVCNLDINPVNTLSNENFNNDRLYARCHPDDKLELINQYLKRGTVGFLGEGINDALALKRADVGIAVSNASDVARDSADIILLEKSLNPISLAIMQSRRVFEHIMMYLICTLTGNIGTLFSLTIISLWWRDIPMLPIQILLNNILTDIPLMLLISDNLSPRMLVKPLHENPHKLIKVIALFALISTVNDLLYFMFFQGNVTATVQTGWFVLSVLSELILVLSLRSTLPILKSPKMKIPLIVTLIFCASIAISLPFIPNINQIFHFVPLSNKMMIYILATGFFYLLANEFTKYIISIFMKKKAMSVALNS